MTKQTIVSALMGIVIGLMVFISFVYLLDWRIKQYERSECSTWKQENIVPQDWQRLQCEYYNINLK